MRPEDYQKTSVNSDEQPINPPQPIASAEPVTPIDPVPTEPVVSAATPLDPIQTPTSIDQIVQAGSIPDNQPITPAVAQNIYPDASNPDQPRPIPSPINNVDVITTVPKKSKKGLIVGLIIAGILILIGGTASAYTFWYSNPQKVISDAMVNAFSAKTSIYTGNLNVDSDNVKVSVDITSKQADAKNDLSAKVVITTGGKSYSTNGNAVVDGTGDVYFKVDIASIATEAKTYIDSLGASSSEGSKISKAIDDFVVKVNNKWVKVSSSDLAGFNKSYSTTKDCVNKTVSKYKDDKAAIAEITNLYSKQPFVVVGKDLGQKDGSFGYQIKVDQTKLKDFTSGLKDTQIYKSINSCDSTYSVDDFSKSLTDKTTSTSDNSVFELWVDSWTHNATKLSLTGDSSGTKVSATIIPKYNQTVTVSAPSDSISLTQLKTYVEELVSSVYGTTSGI